MSDPTSPLPAISEFQHPVEVFVVRPPRRRLWLHLVLLVVTVLTTLVAGAKMQYNFLHNIPNFTAGDEYLPFFSLAWALQHPSRLLMGIPFSVTLLSILLAHEMGHYLYCRRYHVSATLPFFIPAPTLIGTLGAVIRIRGSIRSRAALFDIGIAGPIAGFVVALPTLLVALTLSRPLDVNSVSPDLQLGFPLVFRAAQHLLATFTPSPAARLPLDQLALHPVAIAAWVGMFATALNLLPSGQLDGGHLVYALSPRVHRIVSLLTVFFLIYLGWHYAGWRIWAGLVAAMNIMTWRHRQAPDYPGIGGFRWLLAGLALLMLLLTFTVVPFTGPDLSWK